MKVLIVHAHPEPKSFTAAMKDAAIEVLRDTGHEVQLSDLYAKGFDPVAKAADFPSRKDPDYLVYALEQRHAWDTGTLPDDIRTELEMVVWADLLILSFPMYWFSVPAILKGWIDRVLLSGPTYGGKRFYDRGGLAGRKGMLAFTLGARPHMFGPRAIHGELDVMLRPLLRGTLYYVGMEVLPPFAAYHVPYITDAARGQILDDYRGHLRRLDRLEPMRFPRLDEFDDRLYPRN